VIKQRHWPGTSKWNKVEHRLFSRITHSLRGRPLTSYDVLLQSISATRTGTGLTVSAVLDDNDYPAPTRYAAGSVGASPPTSRTSLRRPPDTSTLPETPAHCRK
jgi:hypothetical protein